MLMLSLWRPWPWAIFDPIANKGIENRPWQPAIRHIGARIAIQYAQTMDRDAFGLFMRLGLSHFPPRHDQYPAGVITGVVTLARIVTSNKTLPDDQKRWFFGPYGWVLTDRIQLETPIECKGSQGLREAPPAVTDVINAQFRTMGRI